MAYKLYEQSGKLSKPEIDSVCAQFNVQTLKTNKITIQQD